MLYYIGINKEIHFVCKEIIDEEVCGSRNQTEDGDPIPQQYAEAYFLRQHNAQKNNKINGYTHPQDRLPADHTGME